MSRTKSRENAFKLIYSSLFVEDADLLPEVEDKFCTELVQAYMANIYEIKSKVADNLKKGMTVERVYKIDLALLYLAVTEIFYIENSAYKVVINEVVNLAKSYSTDNSPSFINGVLAGLVK